jgi:CheY-like chemotaxis protein
MIAEDDDASLNILKVIIKEKNDNIIVIPAIDGQQAVETYNNNAIDMILTDIQMPFMDGFAMIQQIRAIENKTGKHTPILAMTASATPADRERCLSTGADFYITKPVIREDLYKTINKMIERFF